MPARMVYPHSPLAKQFLELDDRQYAYSGCSRDAFERSVVRVLIRRDGQSAAEARKRVAAGKVRAMSSCKPGQGELFGG